MKYYYGHSWKEALANPPVEINTTRQLQQYQECYSVVMPVEENPTCDTDEHFWDIVYMRTNDSVEETEVYEDFDDARADYLTMTQAERDNYKYVVLREIIISNNGQDEEIKKLDSYGL